MTAKVKSVLSIAADALETAAGYALVAVGIYAAIFVDMTGGGSLWKTMRHVQATSQEGIESPNATRVIKVATQAVEQKPHEDRLLAVFDDAPPSGTVAAVYPAAGLRPSAAFTDTPADPKSGKTWKRGIRGGLRNFTVYGKGEQTTSAAMTAGAPAAQAPSEATPTLAGSEGSAAHAETAAVARPGMGSRMSRGTLSASDTSRNVR